MVQGTGLCMIVSSTEQSSCAETGANSPRMVVPVVSTSMVVFGGQAIAGATTSYVLAEHFSLNCVWANTGEQSNTKIDTWAIRNMAWLFDFNDHANVP